MEQSISEMPSFKRLMKALAERKAWEAANPELAAAWTEAMRIDAEIETRREREEAIARSQVTIPDRLKLLNFPPGLLDFVRAPTDTAAMRAARRYFEPDEPRWLVLLGKPGTGKTVAAGWLLGQWLAKHSVWSAPSGSAQPDVALFVPAADLSGLADYREADRDWLERLMRCSLLVLDDLGTERLGEMELGLIQRLLTQRHGRQLRTVITTNLSSEVFRKRYDERIADRIRECARVVDCGKDSMRQKARTGVRP